MKRGGPIERRTPLKNGKALERRTPIARGSYLVNGQPPRRVRERARRKVEQKAKRAELDGHGMPWARVRTIILERAGGRCEGCGTPITLFDGLEGHHRRTRRFGPDCPCNALALCGACHHGPTVHDGPELARELGRIISSHDETDPSTIPVVLRDEIGRVLLACDGTYADAA